MAAASSVAFSQDYQGNGPAAGKTRQQVLDELRQAREQGTLFSSDYDWPTPPIVNSNVTRAQVLAEIKTAREDGTLFADADYDYPHVAAIPAGTGKTRAEVKQEIAAARADGSLFVSDWDYPIVSRQQSGAPANVAAGGKNPAHG